jgi:hypothetical protein
LEYPICATCWAAGILALSELVLLQPPVTVFHPTLSFYAHLISWAGLLMGLISCGSVVLERVLLLQIQREGSWRAIASALRVEHALQALWRAYKQSTATPSRVPFLTSLTAANVSIPSLTDRPSYSSFARLQQLLVTHPFMRLGPDDDLLKSEKAAELASRSLFDWLDSTKKGQVTLQDLERVLDQRTAAQAFASFSSRSTDALISRSEWVAAMRAIFRERRNLASTIADRDNVAGVLSRVMHLVFWLLVFVAVLLLFNVSLAPFLPAVTFFVTLSFIFGNSVKNIFESLLLVLVVRPFDVGDRIEVEGQNYLVTRIYTHTTEATTPNGKLIILPNNMLQGRPIINLSRSDTYVTDFVLAFDPSTTIDQLQLFQTHLQRWSKEEGRQWGEINLLLTDLGSVSAAGPGAPSTPPASQELVVQLRAPLKSAGWGQPRKYGPSRAALLLQMRQLLPQLRLNATIRTNQTPSLQSAGNASAAVDD